MKMIDYLDRDRDRILNGLRTAPTPAEAQTFLEKETDRLLLQYNEDCRSVRVRDAASGMMQALRSSVPLLDTMGEPRIWTSDSGDSPDGGPGAGGRLSRILLAAGAILTLAAFAVPALSAGGTAAAGALVRSLLLPVAGGGCLYLAGRMAGAGGGPGSGSGRPRIGGPGRGAGSTGSPAGPAGAGGQSRRIEITIDPDKLWHSLRGAVMVIDRNLETARESEACDRHKELAAGGGARGITAEEIELFSGLLELADADSPQMAADIRYYLHKKGVEVLPWTAANAAWFEILPAMPGLTAAAGRADPDRQGQPDLQDTAVTIRPALAQDGKLLRKGTAVR